MPASSIDCGALPVLVWPMDKLDWPLHSFCTFAAACAATASSSSAAAFAFRAAISGGKIGPAGCAGGLKAAAGSSQGILHDPQQAVLLQ